MSLFDFFKGGIKVADIRDMLAKELGERISDLKVEIYDTRADLFGECDSMATKEKAILLAGNVNGIEKVNAFKLKVRPAPAAPSAAPSTPVSAPADAPAAPSTPVSAAADAPAAVATASATEDAEVQSQFYQIQRGDSLWKIAQKFYGDGNKHGVLFEENKEVINNPDKIYPGQMIRIPKL